MKDLIKQLRETPSRSKRELLDKAADAIEQLSFDIAALEDVARAGTKAIRMRWNEEIKAFEEYKEPFMTVECPTEDDYNRLQELIEIGSKYCWISAEDRLPDSFKPVIVCREKAKGEFIVEQGHRDVNGWWKVYGTRTKNVSCWMPMPEPPEKALNPCDRCMSGSYRGCDGCGHAEKDSEGGLS